MRLASSLFLTTALCALSAAELTPVAPEQSGLSRERLNRIGAVMKEHVAAGRVPGAIGLILRNGKVGYFESYGYQDIETKKPMPKDAIFRIYSMTKAVTGVAAMMLYEEGKFALNDPVSKYLPEFKDMRVAVDKTDPATGKRVYYTVPAELPITVRDLLRHTSGIDYVGPLNEQGKSAYAEVGLRDPNINLAEAVRRLAKAPLVHQPGSTYHYGLSIDVAGRLVEVLSGKTLDQFFEERIFQPLGMVDTAFQVPEAKWGRLVTLYAPGDDKAPIKRSTAPPQDSFKQKPNIFYGGAGLVSTASDYARFCQMLVDGGQANGTRLLSRKTVELMSSDHLGDLPVVAGGGTVPAGYGFGLTFAVNRGPGRTGAIGSQGEFNWGGAAGTRFWIDPKEKMVGVFMVNILPHDGLTYGHQFKQLAYQAISD